MSERYPWEVQHNDQAPSWAGPKPVAHSCTWEFFPVSRLGSFVCKLKPVLLVLFLRQASLASPDPSLTGVHFL